MCWQSNSASGTILDPTQDGSGYGIYAQQFDASANAVGSETRVNTFRTNDQHAVDVAMDAAGDFVVVWQSEGQDGSGIGRVFAAILII